MLSTAGEYSDLTTQSHPTASYENIASGSSYSDFSVCFLVKYVNLDQTPFCRYLLSNTFKFGLGTYFVFVV